MDRISQAFEQASKEGRAAFVSYVCAGDPDFDTSLNVCRRLIAGGTDILELGVPFSDPLADGLTNQLAAERALESGMTQERVFELVRAIRSEDEDTPIVFYTYYNLIFALGVEKYVETAKAAGVDALLTLDLPPEEAGELLDACQRHGLKTVFIIAPTTPASRMETIAEAANGFIYYVSREGVTGVSDSIAGNIADAVSEIRKHVEVPVVVGFGISTAEHVREVGAAADGVVVGSALVNCIGHNRDDRDAILAAIDSKISELTSGLRDRAS